MRLRAPDEPILPRSPGWVALRSALLTLMWIAYYAALPLISLSAAAVAFYTAPLFIALLARLVLGEAVGPTRWLGIVLGFAGVLIVLRPGADTFSPAALLPVLAAMFYAVAAIVTRARCLGERPLSLALGLNVGLLVAGVLAPLIMSLAPPSAADATAHPFLFGPWAPMGIREWALMAALALLMVCFGTGVAMAYQVAPAAVIGAFDYTYVAFAVLWSYLVFGDQPDALAVAGMALIAIGGVLVAGVRLGRPRSRAGEVAHPQPGTCRDRRDACDRADAGGRPHRAPGRGHRHRAAAARCRDGRRRLVCAGDRQSSRAAARHPRGLCARRLRRGHGQHFRLGPPPLGAGGAWRPDARAAAPGGRDRARGGSAGWRTGR